MPASAPAVLPARDTRLLCGAVGGRANEAADVIDTGVVLEDDGAEDAKGRWWTADAAAADSGDAEGVLLNAPAAGTDVSSGAEDERPTAKAGLEGSENASMGPLVGKASEALAEDTAAAAAEEDTIPLLSTASTSEAKGSRKSIPPARDDALPGTVKDHPSDNAAKDAAVTLLAPPADIADDEANPASPSPCKGVITPSNDDPSALSGVPPTAAELDNLAAD